MKTPQIKICGVTRAQDALAAAHAGARAIGLNFAPESPRCIGGVEAAKRLMAACGELKGTAWAGVFVNPELDELLKTVEALKLDIIQLHGEEPPGFVADLKRRIPPRISVWKAIRVAKKPDLQAAHAYAACDALLIDAKVPGARGGTGRAFDWSILDGFARAKPLVLSGGLSPFNVAEAVRVVRPDWVDVASGVEAAPGIKDEKLILSFVRAVHG